MRVQINGEKRDIDPGATLASLVAELGLGERRIAVELNHGVVSRDRWSAVELRDDDLVEIVQFVGGG